MTKHFKIAAALLIGAALVGCQKQSADELRGGKNATATADTANAVAVINGQAVSKTMYDFHVQRRTNGHPELVKPPQRKMLVGELVEMTLLAQDAKKQGVDQQPEVKARIEGLRRAILAQAMVQHLKDSISAEDVQKQYDSRYGGPGELQYKARHILVDSKEKAEAIIKKLENGADFAELAKKESNGPSSRKGGDLGWFSPGQMVEPFSKAVEGMKKGEFTKEPVKTRFGWHVIQLENTRSEPQPKLAEVEDDIRNQLVQQKLSDTVAQLRAKADIQLHLDRLDSGDEAKTEQPAATDQKQDETPAQSK